MKTKFLTVVLLAFFCVVEISTAQELQSGYFLRGYSYAYRLNPSFQPERSFIGLLAGNTDITLQSDFGLSTVLYPVGDKLVTFLNEDVPSSEFLGGLREDNVIDTHVGLTLLSFGVRTERTFHSFDISLKVGATASVPKDFLRFLKDGTTDSENFDFSDLCLNSKNYLEIGYGLSYRIGERLIVGGRIKGLAGLANAYARFDRFDMTLAGNEWKIDACGYIKGALKGLNVGVKNSGSEGETGFENEVDWASTNYDGPGIAGFGGAVDLGASYQPIDGLTISAAILDIGAIKWKDNFYAVTSGVPFTYSGTEDIDYNGDGKGNDLSDRTDHLGDDLEAAFRLCKKDGTDDLEMLRMTANIGVEYSMPFYDRLSAGLLGTYRFDKDFTMTELRLSANISPIKWISASLNGGFNSFGPVFGGALNIHPAGIAFFIGTDCFITRFTPQYVPIDNVRTNLVFGFNVPLGKRRAEGI
jgi:hypothetical protein